MNCLVGINVRDGAVLEMMFKYGIEEENSTFRAHITKNMNCYVFRTSNMKKLIEVKDFKKVNGYQPGYKEPTSIGYLVPIKECNFIIKSCFLDYPEKYNPEWSTTEKGDWAVNVCIWLMKSGRFPFIINADKTNDIEMDIKGTDIFIESKFKIQVKCDSIADVTGNLFIQTHEINPFGLY